MNGDIICIGHTSGNLFELSGGGEDIIAVKFNTSGQLLWYKQLDQPLKAPTPLSQAPALMIFVYPSPPIAPETFIVVVKLHLHYPLFQTLVVMMPLS